MNAYAHLQAVFKPLLRAAHRTDIMEQTIAPDCFFPAHLYAAPGGLRSAGHTHVTPIKRSIECPGASAAARSGHFAWGIHLLGRYPWTFCHMGLS